MNFPDDQFVTPTTHFISDTLLIRTVNYITLITLHFPHPYLLSCPLISIRVGPSHLDSPSHVLLMESRYIRVCLLSLTETKVCELFLCGSQQATIFQPSGSPHLLLLYTPHYPRICTLMYILPTLLPCAKLFEMGNLLKSWVER